jgi:hypothetical protein
MLRKTATVPPNVRKGCAFLNFRLLRARLPCRQNEIYCCRRFDMFRVLCRRLKRRRSVWLLKSRGESLRGGLEFSYTGNSYFLIPISISSIIFRGFSVRGLSEVTITRSLFLPATSPIGARFVLSRSPPQPKTVIIRPRVKSPAVFKHLKARRPNARNQRRPQIRIVRNSFESPGAPTHFSKPF